MLYIKAKLGSIVSGSLDTKQLLNFRNLAFGLWCVGAGRKFSLTDTKVTEKASVAEGLWVDHHCSVFYVSRSEQE